MFKFCLLAAVALSATVVQAAPQGSTINQAAQPSADKLQLARQIVDRGFPLEKREAMFFATMDAMMLQMREATAKQMPSQDAGAQAIVDAWANDLANRTKPKLASHVPALMDALITGYAVIFTHEELVDILAFVSTRSGQRFVELSPAVIATPAFAQANQAYLQDALSGLPEAQRDLADRLTKYFEAKERLPRTKS